jgi:integrase
MKKNNLHFCFISSFCFWVVNGFKDKENIHFDNESKNWQKDFGRMNTKMCNTSKRMRSEFGMLLKVLYDSKTSNVIQSYLNKISKKLIYDLSQFSADCLVKNTINDGRNYKKGLFVNSIQDIISFSQEEKECMQEQLDSCIQSFKLRNVTSTPLKMIYKLFGLRESQNSIKSCLSLGKLGGSKGTFLTITRKRDLQQIFKEIDEELSDVLPQGRLDYYKLISIFSCFTGLRANELLGFTKEEISDLKILSKRRSITGGKDKIRSFDGNRFAQSLQNATIMQLIESVNHYINNEQRSFFFQLKDNDNLYAQYIGHLKPIKNYSLKKILTNLHGFRRGFATDVYEGSGGNLSVVQNALGHSSIKVTIKYIDPLIVKLQAQHYLDQHLKSCEGIVFDAFK